MAILAAGDKTTQYALWLAANVSTAVDETQAQRVALATATLRLATQDLTTHLQAYLNQK